MNSTVESSTRDDTMFVTGRGHDRLRRELQRMCAECRREMAEQLRHARGDGTLDDNPELLSLLGERAGLERRIAEIEAHLAKAQIVEPTDDTVVQIGSASIFGIRPAETNRSMSWSVPSKGTSRMVGFRSKRR